MDGIQIDVTSAVPPFEQLRARIAAMVADGVLASGSKLPTVRQLATDLGLAVNTVARSYKELEADGVLLTEGRRGSFVRSTVLAEHDSNRTQQAQTAADDFVSTARRLGLNVDEATRLVEQAWPPRADPSHLRSLSGI